MLGLITASGFPNYQLTSAVGDEIPEHSPKQGGPLPPLWGWWWAVNRNCNNLIAHSDTCTPTRRTASGCASVGSPLSPWGNRTQPPATEKGEGAVRGGEGEGVLVRLTH